MDAAASTPPAAPLLGPLCAFPQTDLAAHELLGAHKTALLRFVETASKSKKFPGPNPWSLERRHFKQLQTGGYWVAPKTDGVRAAMVCLEHGGVNCVAFMDRARKLWVLPGAEFQVCTAWLQGSVIDGEIHEGGFLMFDALVVAGVSVRDLPFSGRLAALAQGLALHQRDQNAIPPLRLFLKRFDMGSDFKEEQATAQGVDGLILMPEHDGYIVGRHKTLFKLKMHHTVDFQVGADGSSLCVLDRGGLAAVAGLVAGHPILPAGTIVECEMAGAETAWRVTQVRTDKDHPNDRLTFANTLKNIKEKISYSETLALIK